jgi:hypothetical protein
MGPGPARGEHPNPARTRMLTRCGNGLMTSPRRSASAGRAFIQPKLFPMTGKAFGLRGRSLTTSTREPVMRGEKSLANV